MHIGAEDRNAKTKLKKKQVRKYVLFLLIKKIKAASVFIAMIRALQFPYSQEDTSNNIQKILILIKTEMNLQ